MQIFRHKTKKAKFAVVPVLMVIEIVICGLCLYQNYHLVKMEYEVDLGLNEDLKIVQVSDLHNQVFGLGESVLLDQIAAEDPDIIVVTGDIVDSTHTSYSIALQFVEGAVKIAPVYYITGNHEVRLTGPEMDEFMSDMESLGVVILDDKYIDMGEYILAGVADGSLDDFDAYDALDDSKPVIMLAHEPQYYELYQSLGADLVLTGHYHGGQIIIPGVGGLISPEFELLPKPYEGMTDYSGMTLVISRGLGNSVAPVRINDYPELVVINVT
jgi:predicted MPP superfamily phosphohydrolase